jgi:hypothetical protein
MLGHCGVLMPIVGEQVFAPWARNFDDNIFTASWEVNMSPRRAMVKTFLSQFTDWNGRGAGMPFIARIRRRLPDGSDQPQDFPDPWNSNDAIQALFDNSLSSVTFAIQVRGSWDKVMCVIEHWG